MKDYKILVKNNYLYNRENSLINILQYLIVEKEGKKYLLLQLNNNFKQNVKELEMLIVQNDEKGNVICTSKFTCKDINVRSGKTFIPEVFVELNDNCKDIKADLIEARFNKFIYQNDKLNSLVDKKKKAVSQSNSKLQILKRRTRKPKMLLVPMCVLFTAIMAVPIYFINVTLDTNFMFMMKADVGNPLKLFEPLGHHLIGVPIIYTGVVVVLYGPIYLYRRFKKA